MCHVHNIYNISGEYIRLVYRSINPRPLRDVSGDVALVTGAGGIELAAHSACKNNVRHILEI